MKGPFKMLKLKESSLCSRFRHFYELHFKIRSRIKLTKEKALRKHILHVKIGFIEAVHQ